MGLVHSEREEDGKESLERTSFLSKVPTKKFILDRVSDSYRYSFDESGSSPDPGVYDQKFRKIYSWDFFWGGSKNYNLPSKRVISSLTYNFVIILKKF
jgi:hypothetical protein